MPNDNERQSKMITGSTSLSDESDSDDDSTWQQVPTKRKHLGSPNTNRHKRPHHEEAPTTSNRFEALATDDTLNETTTAAPKPPPIFIPNVENIGRMVNNINKIISNTDYHYKALRDGQVRLVVHKVDAYRKLIQHLDAAKIIYHTFQLKQERSFRVVIKGLHHSTSISDIKAMFLSLGHQVRSVRNIVSRVTKQPLPMFFVDVDPNENNKEIYAITSFENANFIIEAPKKFNDIVQCHRCQDFGHTKTYCRRTFRCVKCGLDHPTAECKKQANTPPKCVHCLGNHTANYKGCASYQKILNDRTTGTNGNHNFRPTYTNFSSNLNKNLNHFMPNSNSQSYAQAVRGDQHDTNNSVLGKIEALLEKQIELTNTMMNMMSMLLNKLCK